MALWNSCNIDIWRSLNSCDCCLRRKFKNLALASCRLGSIVSWSTISFELPVRAKIAEEIDLEKCIFRNFRSSSTLTLTLDRVKVTWMRVSGRVLPTHQIISKFGKTFVEGQKYVCTHGLTHLSSIRSIRSSLRDGLKIDTSVIIHPRLTETF